MPAMPECAAVLPEVAVLDGSMGRLLLNLGLPSDGVLWSARALVDEEYHGMVVDAHAKYIAAGADAITTNNYAVQPCYYRKAFGEEWEEKLKAHTKLAAQLARQARKQSGRPGVKIMGCLPPLVDSHRPDLTEDAYVKEGQAFFARVYETICEALAEDVDLFLAETMGTEQEMLCAVRAAAKQGKPVVVSMAAALRDRQLNAAPSRAAAVAELVLQEVEQGRAVIPTLCFNCGPPEVCTQAVEAIPEALRQRLRDAKVALGVYANLNAGAEKRQANAWAVSKLRAADGEKSSKIARREDMTDALLQRFCDEWLHLGITQIGGCCGSTPEDISVIAAKLKPARGAELGPALLVKLLHVGHDRIASPELLLRLGASGDQPGRRLFRKRSRGRLSDRSQAQTVAWCTAWHSAACEACPCRM